MGINYKYEVLPSGSYNMTITGLNINQTEDVIQFLSNITEKIENTPWGTLNSIPATEMAGMHIEDACASFGVAKVAQLLQTCYMFGEDNETFCGVSPYVATELYQELLLYFLVSLDGYPTATLLDSFAFVIPDAETIRKKNNNISEREDGWDLQLVRADMLDSINAAFTTALQQLVDDLYYLNRPYEIPDGPYAGMSFRQVYEQKSLSTLVEQIFIAEKGSLFFNRLKTHLAALLKFSKNLISYENFLVSFRRFFRLSTDDVVQIIGSMDEDQKKKDYEARVAELISRICKPADNSNPE